ncbi:hypothetical protein LTR78_003800 [Recurvomyces mirabilis]|uniref:Uncharacterized protein n=1 Tax=Recurvomyces mirabilis TaxID=574656 RepID=A0AAE0WR74_9PEZI|nr:hypothetical protein LTR78_003800 [Recurvomyces mirabilis]KAK5154912.1 hypothetical protein LTS14_006493 [Recurvomyces mirabilis]
MGYDYAVAQQVLNEQEKNRILAIYLNNDITALNSTVDWKAAAEAFGSASVESFKKMLNNSLKKLQDKGGEGGAAPSPVKSAGGRKHKATG